FVARGRELTRVGELHTEALEIIEERDDQLAQAQGEKARIGRLHSKSLARVAELDRQMAYVRGVPVLGLLFRVFLIRARR
ncbi:MAG: hypothetical protein HKN19_20180, partial [Halioglobus sp.]|nr:hypothetical protein [Halioglobus sp.]